MDKNWQNDPRLADMDKSKLEMLPLMKSPLFWKFSKWENPLRKLQKLTAL